jgi:hypothetical protein
VFHALSAGKTRQPATVGAPPSGGAVGVDVGGVVVGCVVGVGFMTGTAAPAEDPIVPPPPPHAASRSDRNETAAARRPQTRMGSACAQRARDLPGPVMV